MTTFYDVYYRIPFQNVRKSVRFYSQKGAKDFIKQIKGKVWEVELRKI